MKESKFSAKALMLCPICKNSYYSELEVTVPENFRDMKEINTAKDNNGDIVHLDICSSEAIAPCILWIDEIDKAFSGIDSKGDSGTTSRVLATFIIWLSHSNLISRKYLTI